MQELKHRLKYLVKRKIKAKNNKTILPWMAGGSPAIYTHLQFIQTIPYLCSAGH